jgi:tRNA(Ile)-lysidine synthase
MTAADSIEAAVARAIAACDGRILVAYSGGLDSTVLLHAAAAVVAERSRLVALHVDHGLQSAARDWQRHCRAVSAGLAIDCIVCSVEVAGGGSVEHAARRARYQAFADRVEAGDVLLLAHQRDDQAETVLWRLLRGGGRHALAGMPVRRAIGRGELVRPLLAFPRAALQAWATARHLAWIDDASNAEMRFTRNYLRHAALPALRRQWPDVDTRLVRAAARAAVDANLLQAALDERLRAAGATRHSVPIALLDDRLLGTALLRRWLERTGVPGVPQRVLREIERQARVAADRSPEIAVAGESRVCRHGDRLYLTRWVAAAPAACEWRLSDALDWQGGVLRATRGPGMTGALGNVTVCARRGGERLQLPGNRGSRSVKRLLHDAAVPRWLRANYPLIYSGERLVAVPGIAVDAAIADDAASAWKLAWRVAEFDAGPDASLC